MSLTETVTTPAIPGTVPNLQVHVNRLKRLAIERDNEMMIISMVRKGKPELLFPDLFNDTWKRQIVANWIDGFAREFAEMIAPLPALNCSSKGMKNLADKKQAAQKNLVGTHYWRESKLEFYMISHADRYLTYGFAPFVIEADYESNMPRIRCEDSIGAYYENDRYGKTLRYAKCWYQTAGELVAQFPEYRGAILTKADPYGNRQTLPEDTRLEVVRYCDADGTWLFLPGRSNLVLAFFANPLDRCPVYIAERPGLYEQPSGQFRDVVWVQLARHRMALLGLEIGVKSAGAPLAVPRDVTELAVGPDAVIQTDQPQNIRRVGIEVPASVFQLEGQLKEELLMGSRYPEGRASGIDASVITGKGVQALMGSFDSQISTAQTVLGRALSEATGMCFQMDEKIWPHKKKRIFGQTAGEPYDLTYMPADVIDGDYTCDVSYGFAAGLAPNNAIVMMLQLRGDGLIDRDTVRRNLPFSINVDQMQRQMDIEQTNDAMKQGLAGLLQSLGPMAAQGGDPMPYLNAAALIIKGRQDGKPLEELFIKAFSPETLHPAPPVDPNAPPADPNAPPGADPAAAGAPQMPDPNQPPPAPGVAPGGPVPLQMLVAGMRNGNPNLQAAVSRRLPATG